MNIFWNCTFYNNVYLYKLKEKVSNGLKGLVILQRGEYSCASVNKTLLVCCSARYCFSCSAVSHRA